MIQSGSQQRQPPLSSKLWRHSMWPPALSASTSGADVSLSLPASIPMRRAWTSFLWPTWREAGEPAATKPLKEAQRLSCRRVDRHRRASAAVSSSHHRRRQHTAIRDGASWTQYLSSHVDRLGDEMVPSSDIYYDLMSLVPDLPFLLAASQEQDTCDAYAVRFVRSLTREPVEMRAGD